MHKILELRPEIVVTESDGSVGPSYGTTSINPLILPDLAIDNPRHEVPYLMRSNQRPMDQREKNREVMVSGVAESLSAINAQAHAVVWLTETTEKLEEGAAFPRLQINLDGLFIAFSLHAHMIIVDVSHGVLHRFLRSKVVHILPRRALNVRKVGLNKTVLYVVRLDILSDHPTGTAAGPLAAYLASQGKLKNSELAIEQDRKMGAGAYFESA
jgi:hypothetical protein